MPRTFPPIARMRAAAGSTLTTMSQCVAPRAHLPAPLLDGAVGGPSRCAQEIASSDGCFAGVVRDECRARRALVACADGLIDVGMVRDRALKLISVPQAAFTHHPRHERRRPREPPPRLGAIDSVPDLVLAADNPIATRGHGPVATDGSGHARRLRVTGTTAAARKPIVVFVNRLIDDREAEEGPFLDGQLHDPAPHLRGRNVPAGNLPNRHCAGRALDARGWRKHVEHVGGRRSKCACCAYAQGAAMARTAIVAASDTMSGLTRGFFSKCGDQDDNQTPRERQQRVDAADRDQPVISRPCGKNRDISLGRGMTLEPVLRLGVHEILAPIGVGGMGEVYRARDTPLKRDVAIKVLPDAWAPRSLIVWRGLSGKQNFLPR